MTQHDPATGEPVENAEGRPQQGAFEPPEHIEGLGGAGVDDEEVDRRLAAIEMIGEETALGYRPKPHASLAPEVLYLHASRTINQLVTDRNRAVGILLFVASLLIGASTALLNAPSAVDEVVPLRAIQSWCLPSTFGALAVLSIFVSLILIRTRVGLIYEVAKMNVLMGLPHGRVKRVNPFSIFFLMHLLVACIGGTSAGLCLGLLIAERFGGRTAAMLGLGLGLAFLTVFQILYVATILRGTSDDRLRDAS